MVFVVICTVTQNIWRGVKAPICHCSPPPPPPKWRGNLTTTTLGSPYHVLYINCSRLFDAAQANERTI